MKVHGELLTDAARERVKAPFLPDKDGKKWDLHEMALYIERGHCAVENNPELLAMLKEGITSLGTEA